MTSSVQITKPLQWVRSNVHDDDVHALCKVNMKGQLFLISGSKDCTVRSHVLSSEFLSHPGSIIGQPRRRNYEQWITGLDVFPDGSWVAGSRNGFLQCRDFSGRHFYYSGFPLQSDPAHTDAYKQRNSFRIMSLQCLKDENFPDQFQCLVGYPESFCQFDITTQKIVRLFQFPAAQWVYGFCPVKPGVLATIHGTSLSLLQEVDNTWKMLHPIVRQPRVSRKEEIPFISSIERMPENSETKTVSAVVLSYFGGRTEIRNVETGKILHLGHEHTARVWQSIPFTPVSYVSCADDKTIKLWDSRYQASIATFTGHPGRVSSLCFLDPLKFVAATCPEDPFSSTHKAQFYCYDLRAVTLSPAPSALANSSSSLSLSGIPAAPSTPANSSSWLSLRDVSAAPSAPSHGLPASVPTNIESSVQ